MAKLRRNLSAPALLATVRKSFSKVKDPRDAARTEFSLVDALMSGVAIFGMKYPSLLQFEERKIDPVVAGNLRHLYGVSCPPSDTQLRSILDPIDPNALRPAFKAVFADLQDGKALLPFRFIDGSYLASLDGTGFFSSHDVHCGNCCVKESRDGTITYYHQLLGNVIVHPTQRQVIPLFPEPIVKQDGATKNDCEWNAATRLLKALRRDHPHLSLTIVADSLFGKGPMIKLVRELEMGFIIGVKPGDHESLFSFVEDARALGGVESFEIVESGVVHGFDFINDVPLNGTHPDVWVNVLEYSQTTDGKVTTFSWITHIRLSKENVYQVMRGGRSRWRIENETFNTLKNLGYQFEHNFGHGSKNLSTNFACLMMLAFLIDQAQELCCPAFREFFSLARTRRYVWDTIRAFFMALVLESWKHFYDLLLERLRATFPEKAQANTS
jgi:hypothetical protein